MRSRPEAILAAFGHPPDALDRAHDLLLSKRRRQRRLRIGQGQVKELAEGAAAVSFKCAVGKNGAVALPLSDALGGRLDQILKPVHNGKALKIIKAASSERVPAAGRLRRRRDREAVAEKVDWPTLSP